MKYILVAACLFLAQPVCAQDDITLAVDTLNIKAKIAALEPKKLSSVLVQRHGTLLHESYHNGTSAKDLHNIRSASKSLTGLMFGKAIADGHFRSEQDKVLPVFPGHKDLLYPSRTKDAMSFMDLLSMTNPLECDDNNNFSAGHEERMYLRRDWVGFFLNLPLRANPPWEKPMAKQPMGRDFAYCTAGISITAAAIEKVSGKRLSDYTQEVIFNPLGIAKTQWPYNAEGITQGGGGLDIRPKDLLKIGQLVLQKGRWKGEQIIPEAWIEKSLTPYSVSFPELGARYGLTWWIFDFPYGDGTVRTYAAAGNGGNYLFIAPDLDLAAVITATAYNTSYMHQQTHKIFAGVILPALAAQ